MTTTPGAPSPDPYAPPRSDIRPPAPPIEPGTLTREEVLTFAGDSGPYYWRRWSHPGRRGLLAGFNWAALLFSMLWLLYRRMYREFGYACGATFLLGVGEALLESVASAETIKLVSRTSNVAFALTVGFLANGLYRRRALAAVALARTEPDPERRHALLASRGGTRWSAVLIGAVVFIALGLLAAQVPD